MLVFPTITAPAALRRAVTVDCEPEESATSPQEPGERARLNGRHVSVQHPGRGSRPDAPHAEVVLNSGDTVSAFRSGGTASHAPSLPPAPRPGGRGSVRRLSARHSAPQRAWQGPRCG